MGLIRGVYVNMSPRMAVVVGRVFGALLRPVCRVRQVLASVFHGWLSGVRWRRCRCRGADYGMWV